MKFILFLLVIVTINAHQQFQPSEEIYESFHDSSDPIFDFIEQSEEQITQYAYGFWIRWHYTDLLLKRGIYTLARLTSNQDHKDFQKSGDRTLATFVNDHSYIFSTYDTNNPQVNGMIRYGKRLDYSWNYLYFCYQAGTAKGYIWLGSEIFQEVFFTATHQPTTYLHFLIKKEFRYSAFNGYYANIILRVGEGSYLSDKEKLIRFANSEGKLSDNAPQINNEHRGNQLVELEKEVSFDDEAFESMEENVDGADEYAVSGWVKWVDTPKMMVWNTVVRVTSNRNNQDMNNPGDRTLTILKSNGYYSFNTYSCIEECKMNLNDKIKYDQQVELSWTFLYIGYSAQQKQLVGYVKYITYDRQIVLDGIIHYKADQFYIFLQKDTHYPGFNGLMKSWVLNIGEGSFVTEKYSEDETSYVKLGFSQGLSNSENYKGWEYEELTEEAIVEEIIESEDIVLNGIMEYRYSFWSRFQWNMRSNQLEQKNDWIGVSRMSTNKDWQKDINLGDRTLVIFLRNGIYQFSTYSLDKQAINEEVKYDDNQLDGKWVYLSFGYKRVSKNQSIVDAYVLFEGGLIRQCKFSKDIIHYAITEYIYFSIGSVGTKFDKFNGYFGHIELKLGEDAQVGEGDDRIRQQAGLHPDLKLDTNGKSLVLIEDIVESNDEIEVEEGMFQESYSVEVWFRWIYDEKKSVLGQIYDLSYNKKNSMLGLYLSRDNKLVYKSYSNKNDQIIDLIQDCPFRNIETQLQWTYSYFGYEKNTLFYYTHFQKDYCQSRSVVYHRLPHKLHLSYLKGFLGKIAHLTLNFNLFRTKDFQSTKTFHEGLQLFPTSIDWSDLSHELITISSEDTDVISEEFLDTDTQNMDGQSTYGFGMWLKYLHAYPTRNVQQPKLSIIARLTSNNEHSDQSSIGDRVLSAFLKPKSYLFSTYDINRSLLNTNLDVPLFQEGKWTFIYVSYRESNLVAFVAIGTAFKKESLNNLQHQLLPAYAKFVIGSEFNYPAFNGFITGLIVRFDSNAFISDPNQIKDLIQQKLPQPSDPMIPLESLIFEEEIAEELGIEHYNLQEYSIFGWFKASPSLVRQKANCEIMRLTNNPPDFADNIIGFRTLQVYFKTIQYEFATYDLVQPQPYLKNTVQVGNDFGTWTYFLMAYSFDKNQVFHYIEFPNRSQQSFIQKVTHMTPGYLAFYAGKEFNGYLAHVGVGLGAGAYQDKNKDNYPSYHKFDPEPDVERQLEGYLYEEIEIVMEETQIQGATEYAWGIWTRWLTAYATSRKMPQHSLVRMTKNRDHKDHSQPGDRVLSVFIERDVYVFSTYDAQNPLDRQSIEYEDDLEGNWNFVYFSYDNGVSIGYVYFSELERYKSAYFKVQHYPILDYVRVIAGAKEFIYDPFFGQLYDLRVRIGCGFISKDEELKAWMYNQLEPEPTHFLKEHIDALEEEKQMNDSNQPEPIETDDLELVPEYAVSGWVKYTQTTHIEQVVFRLTSIPQSQLKNNQNPGDNTLMCEYNNHFIYSTYNYHNLDNFNPQKDVPKKQLQLNKDHKGEWVFLYFGYDFYKKMAFGEMIGSGKDLISAKFEVVNHYLPLKLYLYLGSDGILPNFKGKLMNWDLHFGPHSYTEQPQDFIYRWPADAEVRNKQKIIVQGTDIVKRQAEIEKNKKRKLQMKQDQLNKEALEALSLKNYKLCLSKLMQMTPNESFHNNFACYYRAIGQPKKALLHLEQLLELEKKSANSAQQSCTHLNMSAVLADLKCYQKAQKHAKIALSLASKQQQEFCYINLINLYLTMKKYQEALILIRQDDKLKEQYRDELIFLDQKFRMRSCSPQFERQNQYFLPRLEMNKYKRQFLKQSSLNERTEIRIVNYSKQSIE